MAYLTEAFANWTCLPTQAPTSAPTFHPCSEQLSKLCVNNITGTYEQKLGTNRVCISDCTDNNCVQWGDDYHHFKNMWKKTNNNFTGTEIETLTEDNMVDYAAWSGIIDVTGNAKNEVNCWLNCMGTSECMAYKWNNNVCTLYSEITIESGIGGAEVNWVCNKDMTEGTSCNYTELLHDIPNDRNGYVGDDSANFEFQPGINCNAFHCPGGQAIPFQTEAPVSPGCYEFRKGWCEFKEFDDCYIDTNIIPTDMFANVLNQNIIDTIGGNYAGDPPVLGDYCFNITTSAYEDTVFMDNLFVAIENAGADLIIILRENDNYASYSINMGYKDKYKDFNLITHQSGPDIYPGAIWSTTPAPENKYICS